MVTVVVDGVVTSSYRYTTLEDVTLELNRRGGGRAAVSLCGGGGQGDALILWC